MAGDGSAALGVPQVGGTLVNPRGYTKKMSVGAIRGAAGVTGAMIAADRQSNASAPTFGRVGYLAASETEIALIKTK